MAQINDSAKKDLIKQIVLLEFMAIVGIIAPVWIWMAGFPVPALFVAGLYWCIPGLPYPILHLVFGGDQPFAVSYPVCLALVFYEWRDMNVAE